jgi:hypothetical protein
LFPRLEHAPAAGAEIKNLQHQVFVADAFGGGLQAQVAVIGGETGQGVDLDQARIAFFVQPDIGAGDIQRVQQLMGAQGEIFQFFSSSGSISAGQK